MIRSILVPLDGSAFGEHALPLALARRTAATVTLLHVQTDLANLYGEAPYLLDEELAEQLHRRQREAHLQYLEQVASRARELAPVPVTTLVRDGDVPHEVMDQA